MADKATNFFAWMDEQYARPSLDEETMAEHDKHYHKGYYNPETDRCEKRDKEKDRDSSSSSLPPFTEKMLLDRFGMKVLPFDIDIDGEEAKRFTTPSFREEWRKYALQPSESDQLETISLIGNVLADIEDRYNCGIQIDNLLIANFKPYDDGRTIGGWSLADRIAIPESTIVIASNAPRWDRKTFGHNDYQLYKQDMMRHEIGHALTTPNVVREFWQIKNELEKNYGLKGAELLLKHCTSDYAYDVNIDFEYIAELFSRVTSSDYKNGILMPSQFESLIRHLLQGV